MINNISHYSLISTELKAKLDKFGDENENLASLQYFYN